MSRFDGFILAAGLGTRMGLLSQVLPKPAWTLQGIPVLCWGARQMQREGLTHLGCNAHHLPEHLRQAAVGVLDVFEEPTLLGSAGGLCHIVDRAADPLGVWNGDAIADVPWRQFKAAHLQRGADLSWLLVPHDGGPWNAVYLDAEGRIQPPGVEGEGPYHFTGAAFWGAAALALLPEGPSDTKRDILPRLTHHAGIVVPPFFWAEIGTPDQLIAAAARLAPKEEGRLEGCYVHPTAIPSRCLRRCILGPGACLPEAFGDEDALWFEFQGRQIRLSLGLQ